jgi:hypothetical protein
MNKRFFTAGFVAIMLLLPATMTLAQSSKKHHPLTLKQIGKNIGHTVGRTGQDIANGSKRIYKNGEYGVRKGGENVSDTTHRTEGRNSLVRNRGKKKTDVVKPDGQHITKKVG